MWRRTLQPQALNLVRVLPIDNAAWVSARISSIPQLAPSLRYWMELRDDVLILYPSAHLLTQHHNLLTNPPSDSTPFTLRPVDDTSALEKLPPDHILSLAELVPTPHVVTFVLPAVRITCREHNRSIHLRGPGMRVASAAHLVLESRASTVRWRDDLNQAIHRDRKRLSDFRVLRHVGKGASGRVYEIEDRLTSERMALKVIEKTTVFESKDTYRHAMDERLVLQIIRHHPYILDMRYAFQNAKRLFLVTEYCSGGDLFEYMNHRVAPLDENTTRFISAQVLLALAHLHHLGIVYRDLKLENILIDSQGHVRLADFGLTKVLRQHDGTLARTNTFCGTREYVAPEMLRGESYDTSLDFWTFGILLYEMMAGRTPFYTSDHSEIYRRIEKSPVFYPRHLSPEARSLLSKLLVRDPSKRLGATKSGIKAIFRHSWYKSIDWESMMDRTVLESPLKRTTTFQQRQHENHKRLAQDRQEQQDQQLQDEPSSKLKKLASSRNIHNNNNNKYYEDIHMYYKPNRRKTRKEVKQERAFANVLADVQADLRYASTRYHSNTHIDNNTNTNNMASTGSFSGSLLGLGRPRTPMGSGDLVLAGYSFYDSQQRRAYSEHAQLGSMAMNSSRSASATFSSRGQWIIDGDHEASGNGIDTDMDSRAYHVFDEGPLTSKSASAAATTESSLTVTTATASTATSISSATRKSSRRAAAAAVVSVGSANIDGQPQVDKKKSSSRSFGYKRHHQQPTSPPPPQLSQRKSHLSSASPPNSVGDPASLRVVTASPSVASISSVATATTSLMTTATTPATTLSAPRKAKSNKSTLVNSSPVSWPGIIARSLSLHKKTSNDASTTTTTTAAPTPSSSATRSKNTVDKQASSIGSSSYHSGPNSSNHITTATPSTIRRRMGHHHHKHRKHHRNKTNDSNNSRINSTVSSIAATTTTTSVIVSSTTTTTTTTEQEEHRRRDPHTPKVSEATLDDAANFAALTANTPLGAIHMADNIDIDVVDDEQLLQLQDVGGYAATAVELRDVAQRRQSDMRRTLMLLTGGLGEDEDEELMEGWEDGLGLGDFENRSSNSHVATTAIVQGVENDDDNNGTMPFVAMDDDDDDDEYMDADGTQQVQEQQAQQNVADVNTHDNSNRDNKSNNNGDAHDKDEIGRTKVEPLPEDDMLRSSTEESNTTNTSSTNNKDDATTTTSTSTTDDTSSNTGNDSLKRLLSDSPTCIRTPVTSIAQAPQNDETCT